MDSVDAGMNKIVNQTTSITSSLKKVQDVNQETAILAQMIRNGAMAPVDLIMAPVDLIMAPVDLIITPVDQVIILVIEKAAAAVENVIHMYQTLATLLTTLLICLIMVPAL